MADRSKEPEVESLQDVSPASDAILDKYVVAGDIANRVLNELVSKCIVGASCREICTLGDKMIVEECGKIFKKNKTMKKGVAFPTCVSVNDCVCHFSPLNSDPDQIIKEGDMVKIDLSVNIDGFPGGIAHTFVVGATEANPSTGIKADILKAAHMAEEAILRTLKVGKSNKDVGSVFNKVVGEFQCKGIEDMVCFRVTKNNMEDEKKIIMVPGEGHGKDYVEQKFELFEVYCIDIFVTNSESNKPRQKDTRTTIYKHTNSPYNLKLKSSKELMKQLSAINQHMAFNLRSMENESKARMGIKECVEHAVVIPYPPLYVKDDSDFVAHFKFTAIITPTGLLRTTIPPWNDKLVKSDKKIEDESINKLLSESYSNKKKNKTK